MESDVIVWLALLMAAAAALYSSVGHGGASAYLALMALFSVAPDVMRPTALALNLVVASFVAARFALNGQTNPRLLLAFAITATPAAFIGGRMSLAPDLYRPIVAVMLLMAAALLLWRPKQRSDQALRPPSLAVALPTGAALGLLAGLTGTGGIFLSPLIILMRWENPRRTAGVAAAFIVLNSLAGLAGNWSSVERLPPQLPWLMVAVFLGGLLGSWLGVSALPRHRMLQGLALVLMIASAKLLTT